MAEVASNLSFREERLLLHELNHRINNEFSSIISAVSVAQARTKNDEVKAALAGVENILHHHANIHHALQTAEGNGPINAAAYLRKLCSSISRANLDAKKVELVLVARPLRVESERCWRLGMIVLELVTNAARHAFAGHQGVIRVELTRVGSYVECKVSDNGSAAAGIRPGRGLKIVDELTKRLNGRFEQAFGIRGSVSIVEFPYRWQREEQERQEQKRQEPKRYGADLMADHADPSERTNMIARQRRSATWASNAASERPNDAHHTKFMMR